MKKVLFDSFDSQPQKHKLSREEAFEERKKICEQHKPILPKMPEPDIFIEFDAWVILQRHPIVINTDFEALFVKCEEKKE